MSDVNSRSLFNVMAGSPLPFRINTFWLQVEKESATNLGKQVAWAIQVHVVENNWKLLSIVTDSGNEAKRQVNW